MANKPKRLRQAATEFNVGTSTILDLLVKKGFKDITPNTKLSSEQYDILINEYAADKKVKEEASKLEILDRKKMSEIEESVTQIAEEKSAPLVEEETLYIKETALGTVKSTHEAEPINEPIEVVVEETVQPTIEETTPQEEVITPVAEVVEEKVEETIPEVTVEPKSEEPVEEKQPEAPVVAVVAEESKVEETPPADSEKAEVHEESKGPKVVGKVDLDSINTKTRPKRKTEQEKQEAKDARVKEKIELKQHTKAKKKHEQKSVPNVKPVARVETKAPVVTKEQKKQESGKPKIDFLPTKVEKLVGPKVVDKIDVSKFAPKPKRKPVATSKDDPNAKKKRKRIVNKPGEGNRTGGAPQGGPNRKPHVKRGGKPDNRGVRKPIVKVEPSPEDIQKQIKETLSKLQGKGKSKASKHSRKKREAVKDRHQEEVKHLQESERVLKLTEFVTANEIANMMDMPVNKVIGTCMAIGLFVSINQRLDAEAINLLADEFGYTVEFVSTEVIESIGEDEIEEHNDTPRAPVVTVMGHVDHGKTKLLDHIRHANVVAGEAGGITQHIGAYEVMLDNGKRIAFLDTPGHEAFTAMRARGAKITDVAIIVIAADDSVMPQTVEAISHAQAANVPIVFAINKIDRPTANPEKIKEKLSQMNILVEDWGGKYQSQEISAKDGINISELLDKVLLEAEMLELKADPDRTARGVVLESRLDKGRGYVANILVQNGSLRVGDMVIAGPHYGKVKAMYNERNLPMDVAGPSTPVLMLGLNGAPQAGDTFNVMKDEREVKNIATKRLQLQREQGLRTQKHITLDEIGRRIAIGDFKELNLIIKGDVDGSIEALSDQLLKLSNEEIQVNIIHKSVGQISESDVLLATASNAIILGFQVRPSLKARKLAESEQIDIRTYSIIYKAINEIKDAMEGMLSPEIQEKITCNIEVRETFKIKKVGTIAGCMVLDGNVNRNTRIRLIRDGIVIYAGLLGSLKRFKDDAKEVKTGYECGLNIENFNDIKVGDIIEGFESIEVKRSL